MTTVTHGAGQWVVGGVDTHKDFHVAAVVDVAGRILGVETFPANRHGYRRMLSWMQGHGEVIGVGVEGCGSWGAGLARHLADRAVKVVEVNRPNRQKRRLRGKSDPVDAEAAARAVLCGEASVTPKTGTGPVEALRQLRVARAGAIKAKTSAANQLHSLCDTAPETIRAQLRRLPLRKKVETCERWRPGGDYTPVNAAKRAMLSVARRWRALDQEMAQILADTAIRPPFALEAFPDLDEDVCQSIRRIRTSPFIPRKDSVRGFVYEVEKGTLREVTSE